MNSLIVILTSFVVAGILRVILRNKKECMMAKFIPQLVMLTGGLISAYIFVEGNWNIG